ncbi:hypothetical protein M422DRAFT_248265 [Sphaerobolus stellatus SS14]|uniref:Uncharacterized protein n=1 Tax=Sphaerobolus stellatus (strain SS14) TaxID=990650 RepID=A0A0C9W507_SPHS4|nr:hypothetical protein M422DRAFT_248265 [Sphaerobolus stellatus SS14]
MTVTFLHTWALHSIPTSLSVNTSCLTYRIRVFTDVFNTVENPCGNFHECRAEMRLRLSPLPFQAPLAPDPHCASCQGTFVEMIENEQDDPRRNDIPLFGGPGDDGDAAGISGGGDAEHAVTTATLVIFMGGPDGMRAAPLSGDGNGSRRVMMFPRLSDLLATPPGGPSRDNGTFNADGPHLGGRSPAQSLLVIYLLSSLLSENGNAPPNFGPFREFMGSDLVTMLRTMKYVALQALMTEIMNNGGLPLEPPTPEDVINDLPRIVLRSDHPICHEPFNPALAAFPDADTDLTPSTSDSKTPESSPAVESEQEPLGVELPRRALYAGCLYFLKKNDSPDSPFTNNGSAGPGPGPGAGPSFDSSTRTSRIDERHADVEEEVTAYPGAICPFCGDNFIDLPQHKKQDHGHSYYLKSGVSCDPITHPMPTSVLACPDTSNEQ